MPNDPAGLALLAPGITDLLRKSSILLDLPLLPFCEFWIRSDVRRKLARFRSLANKPTGLPICHYTNWRPSGYIAN